MIRISSCLNVSWPSAPPPATMNCIFLRHVMLKISRVGKGWVGSTWFMLCIVCIFRIFGVVFDVWNFKKEYSRRPAVYDPNRVQWEISFLQMLANQYIERVKREESRRRNQSLLNIDRILHKQPLWRTYIQVRLMWWIQTRTYRSVYDCTYT